ncbi:MAG TPA: winged helix-turn-helix domain-containing protein [Pyrinomonadaceae bacterium]|jgi:TolB-like protein
MQEKVVDIYEFGPFRLDTVERRLLRDDGPVTLTPKLFDMLLLLVQRKGHLVTKEELRRRIWPEQFIGENNLTVRMSALRKALGDGLGGNRYIETVPGDGYRFIARVKAVEQSLDPPMTEAAGVHRTRINALAVLPFVNESVDPELEYLSDGVTDSIINSLSQLSNLRVIARSTVFSFKGDENDPVEAGRKLGVDVVLAGRVSRLGDKLVVGVELVDVRDSTQVWGETYNQLFSDLLEVQEQIARKISEKLSLRLTNEEMRQLVKQPTTNVEAYHVYLKGHYFWNKRTVKGINTGIKHFEEAIKLDATYALAYVGLANCYRGLAVWNVLPPNEAFPLSKRYVSKALEIDGSLAEAYASLAIIELYNYNWIAAEKIFKVSIELNPGYATARQWYSLCLASTGQMDEAIAVAKLAQNTDPLSINIRVQLGRIYYFMRQYEKAIEQCDEAIEIDPSFAPAHGIKGLAYVLMERYESAILALHKAADFMEGDPEGIALLGYAYGKCGRRREALAAVAELKARSKQRYTPPYLLAYVYSGLKEKGKAFEWLDNACSEHCFTLSLLKVDPIYDCLRSDARFSALLRRVGLIP